VAFSGESLSLTLPAITLTAAVDDYSGALVLAAPQISGRIEAAWGAALVLPKLRVASGPDFGWHVTLSLPAMQATGTVIRGGAFDAALVLPSLRSAGAIRPAWAGSMSLPGLAAAGEMVEEIVWDVALALPAIAAQSAWVLPIGATFDVWAVNTRTLGHSTYTNFPFTSLFRFAGNYYGCAADGIYLLEGDDDQGTAIAASTLHGISELGTEHLKRVDSAYLNVRSDGDLKVTFKVDETEERIYSVADPGDGLHTVRCKFGRGLDGRNWQFGVRNASGSRFTLSQMQVSTVKLSRRT
jgi:hypothetical protein